MYHSSTRDRRDHWKVALRWVTGASSGIGRASAIELARRGARVVVASRRKAELDDVVEEIASDGGAGLSVVCDVTREDDITRMVDFAIEQYGRLDIAFNNAGAQGEIAPFVVVDTSQYDAVFDTNVRAIFHCMKREAEIMLRQGSSSIINNASMSENFSKWLGRYCTKQGVADERLNFHSFRHGFADACRAVNMEQTIYARLGGWQVSASESERYGGGYAIDRMERELRKLRFSTVEKLLPALQGVNDGTVDGDGDDTYASWEHFSNAGQLILAVAHRKSIARLS
jgi:NADPH:quinone reductase-like Zn-dependent oxidoreductase